MVGTSRLPALLGVVVTLVACGGPGSGPGNPPANPLSYMSYSCDGGSRLYNLADPYDQDEVPKGALAALERVQQSEVSAFGPDEAEEWDPVVLTEKLVVFLYEQRGPGFPYSEVAVRRHENGGWRFSGSGDCTLEAIPRDGWPAAEWRLVENPQPDDRELNVKATERGCASGRKLPPEGFRSFVHYDERRISIALFSKPLEPGGYNCQSNPSTEVTIELDEPVGGREIFDVGVYPARPEFEVGRQ